jgi:hypothetical protein
VVDGRTVVTLTFTGPDVVAGSLADGRYTLRIVVSQVTNAAGPQLDGDANGQPGGDYVFGDDPVNETLFRLFGDSDGNSVVDALDLFRLRTTFNKTPSDPGFLAYFDFDGNGVIDAVDLFRFRQRFGSILP